VSRILLPETATESGVWLFDPISTENWLASGSGDVKSDSLNPIVIRFPETVIGFEAIGVGAVRSGPKDELFVTGILLNDWVSFPNVSCTELLLVA
jgi:hypothetical protein